MYNWKFGEIEIRLKGPKYLDSFDQIAVDIMIDSGKAIYGNLMFFRSGEDIDEQLNDIIEDFLYIRDLTEDRTRKTVNFLYSIKEEIKDAFDEIASRNEFRLYTLFWGNEDVEGNKGA